MKGPRPEGGSWEKKRKMSVGRGGKGPPLLVIVGGVPMWSSE